MHFAERNVVHVEQNANTLQKCCHAAFAVAEEGETPFIPPSPALKKKGLACSTPENDVRQGRFRSYMLPTPWTASLLLNLGGIEIWIYLDFGFSPCLKH